MGRAVRLVEEPPSIAQKQLVGLGAQHQQLQCADV